MAIWDLNNYKQDNVPQNNGPFKEPFKNNGQNTIGKDNLRERLEKPDIKKEDNLSRDVIENEGKETWVNERDRDNERMKTELEQRSQEQEELNKMNLQKFAEKQQRGNESKGILGALVDLYADRGIRNNNAKTMLAQGVREQQLQDKINDGEAR